MDLARRNLLIETHLALVPPIARRVKKRLPPSFELADLESEGNVGLIRAAERYCPGEHRGTPFSAFARPRIRGAMIDSVRRKAWLENTANPLADAPEPAHHRTLPFLVRGHHATNEPRSKPGQRGGWRPPFDWQTLPDGLARAIRRLPQRQQAILDALYGEGASLADVAAFFNLTAAAVRVEHARALDQLRTFMVRNLRRDNSTLVFLSAQPEKIAAQRAEQSAGKRAA